MILKLSRGLKTRFPKWGPELPIRLFEAFGLKGLFKGLKGIIRLLKAL